VGLEGATIDFYLQINSYCERTARRVPAGKHMGSEMRQTGLTTSTTATAIGAEGFARATGFHYSNKCREERRAREAGESAYALIGSPGVLQRLRPRTHQRPPLARGEGVPGPSAGAIAWAAGRGKNRRRIVELPFHALRPLQSSSDPANFFEA
jgi:hypothetical protein